MSSDSCTACHRPPLARGLCSMHYARWRRANPGAARPIRPKVPPSTPNEGTLVAKQPHD